MTASNKFGEVKVGNTVFNLLGEPVANLSPMHLPFEDSEEYESLPGVISAEARFPWLFPAGRDIAEEFSQLHHRHFRLGEGLPLRDGERDSPARPKPWRRMKQEELSEAERQVMAYYHVISAYTQLDIVDEAACVALLQKVFCDYGVTYVVR